MKNRIARDAVIQGLEAALIAHREGRVLDIHDGWDEAAALDRDDSRLSIALNFWECWADAGAHQWRYYEGLSADDWPRLANVVVVSLEQDLEIVDPELLRHFAPRPCEPSKVSRLIDRVRSWLRQE
jgi:hypothetical protein